MGVRMLIMYKRNPDGTSYTFHVLSTGVRNQSARPESVYCLDIVGWLMSRGSDLLKNENFEVIWVYFPFYITNICLPLVSY